MPTAGETIFNFILPALLVAGCLWVAWRPRKNRPADGRWMGAIAVSGAYALAACGISGTPHWPPGTGDASYWLVWFTIPVALLGWLDALLQPATWLRAGLLLALFCLASELLIAPLGATQGRHWIAGLSAGALIWWWALERSAERLPGLFVPVVLTIEFAGAAAVLGLSNDIKPSQTAVALMGMAIAAGMANWRRPGLSPARGAILAWTVWLLGAFLLVHFYYYTEPPAAAVALLLIAPALALGGDLPPARRLGPRRRAAVRILPVILAVAAAVGLSAAQAMHSQAAADKSGAEVY